MEQRITSLLLPAPEAELEASCKELDEKVTLAAAQQPENGQLLGT